MPHIAAPAGEVVAQSAGAAAGRIAASLLQRADQAAHRMPDQGDPEALHDFRTALRRLRVTLRFYRDALGNAASKDIRRGLKALTRQTNAGRDAEVWALWLRSRAAKSRADFRIELEGRAARLEAERDKAYRDIAGRALRAFDKIRSELHGRLSRVPAAGGAEPFRRAASAAIKDAAAELRRRFHRLKKSDDERDFHIVRIRGKRLRYLLEPFAGGDVRAGKLIADLKRLQEHLGELHDMHGLIQAGGPHAGRLARERSRRLERSVRRHWLRSRHKRLAKDAWEFGKSLKKSSREFWRV